MRDLAYVDGASPRSSVTVRVRIVAEFSSPVVRSLKLLPVCTQNERLTEGYSGEPHAIGEDIGVPSSRSFSVAQGVEGQGKVPNSK